MKKCFFIILFVCIVAVINSFAKPKVVLTKLTDSVWMYTTYKQIDSVETPMNGIVVVGKYNSLYLIGAPWNDTTTRLVIDTVSKLFKKVDEVILTSYKEDQYGGISYLKYIGFNEESGVGPYVWTPSMIEGTPSHARRIAKFWEKHSGQNRITTSYSPENGWSEGHYGLWVSTGRDIFLYYPGRSVTPDNYIVWLSFEKILFAGSFVEPLESDTLTDISKADLVEWAPSIHKVLQKYSDAKVVVPSHGKPGDISLLHHTLNLLEEYKLNNK